MDKAKMRILMIYRSDAYTGYGGGTVQMERTAIEVQKLGVEVTIRLANELTGINFHDFNLAHIFNLESSEEPLRVSQMMNENHLPYVVSSIFWDPTYTSFMLYSHRKAVWRILRKYFGDNLGFAVYNFWQDLKLKNSSEWRNNRHIFLHSKGFLPNSRLEGEMLSKLYGLDISMMHVIPNGIDPELFTGFLKPKNDYLRLLKKEETVIQAGRIEQRKNNLSLINALWNDPLNLVFVGAPNPYEPKYVEECYKAGKKRGRVFFLGQIPHTDLSQYYTLANVHVLPSWWETTGLASLEAAVCGCNIVTTLIGATREYFKDDAWYCHPAHPETIREAVLEALSSPFKESLRNRILEKFTWQQAAKETLKAYEFVLGNL